MTTGLGPTVGSPHPGYGLRVRFDSKALDLAAADYMCPCGRAEDAVGYDAVQQLVVRFGRHQRDDCPIPEIRTAAARHYAALQHSLSKRRRK
ncbi:hypothetical protein ACF1BE_19695 [Streptomyces sp. NPDC014991]|uniref:hypothetical protein n=1 Tax=Streptomyces sp. NPDC014991 TaxID=3364935 RepID=UPI0036FC91CA